MKKKSFYYLSSLFVAAAMFTGCSDSEVTPGEPKETGRMEVKFEFDAGETVQGRATTKSTAIPVTSWKNVKNLRILLYDGSGVIKQARTVAANKVPTSGSTTITETFTNVVLGEYTVVAVANVTSGTDPLTTDPIVTYGAGADPADPSVWNDADMIAKSVNNMLIKHKETNTWPGSIPTTHEFYNDPAKHAFVEPSEIFIGYGNAKADVKESGTVPVTVKLKREVALMRVRLDVSHNNVAKMNWETNKAAVFIYTLPESIGLVEGNNGGISKANSKTDHIQINNGFNKGEPTEGYSGPTDFKVLTDKFTYWKDIKVFPNYAGRGEGASSTSKAKSGRKYFIAISGEAKNGHRYADQSLPPCTGGESVFWYNIIDDNFFPNSIREVNLFVTTGGYPVIPVDPLTYGDLDVKVEAPEDWASQIDVTDIIF